MQQTEPIQDAQPAPVHSETSFAVFLRGGQRFAVPIQSLLEVIPGQVLTCVPRARREVAGLLNLRGEVLTVLLADAWLGVASQPYQVSKPILVLSRERSLFGVQADSVHGLVTIPSDQIQPQAPGCPDLPSLRCLGSWQGPGTDATPLILLAPDAFAEVVDQPASKYTNPE